MDFCLVHISDFHLRAKTQVETDDVLKSLVGDLQTRIQVLDLPRPYIALSGDLAYGGLAEEYALVDDFVDDMMGRLNGKKALYCGGNHDVNWSTLSSLCTDMMNEMVEKRGGIVTAETHFEIAADREAMKAGMGPYYSFLEKHGVHSGDDLYYIETAEVAGIKLNFISLNSAFVFSRKYNYHGYVGRRQFESVEKVLSSQNGPTFNITLVHHPLEAIVPSAQESTKRHLFAFSDVILNGHVHSPRVSVEYTANMLGRSREGPPPVISCARCVFDEANDPTVTSGYSIIGLDFEYEKVSAIKVWEVQFDRTGKKWYYDERKGTYPLVVAVSSGKGGALGSSRIGPKVTDAEKELLGKWKKNTSA